MHQADVSRRGRMVMAHDILCLLCTGWMCSTNNYKKKLVNPTTFQSRMLSLCTNGHCVRWKVLFSEYYLIIQLRSSQPLKISLFTRFTAYIYRSLPSSHAHTHFPVVTTIHSSSFLWKNDTKHFQTHFHACWRFHFVPNWDFRIIY